MSAKKGKVKVAEKAMKDPELIGMFNQMVGTSDPDPNIVIPKYNKIWKLAEDMVSVLKSFAGSKFAVIFSHTFGTGFSDISNFVKLSEPQLQELKLEKNDHIMTGEELNELNKNPEKLQQYISDMSFEYKVKGLGEQYKKLKDSPIIKEIIMIAKNLQKNLRLEKDRSKKEIHNLEKRESLSSDFITNADGDFLRLFNFTTLDFKQLYFSDSMTNELSSYLLYVLFLVYKKAIDVTREITSPDIDVDKFSEVLVSYIDNIRKKIPRCDDAFNKISDSVSLLKNNFGEYYKDFIISQNPGIIVEHFVSDVAQNSKTDFKVTQQFKKIVEFCRKNMAGKINDPKIQKIFSMVSENIDILEDKGKKRTNEKDETKGEEPLEKSSNEN